MAHVHRLGLAALGAAAIVAAPLSAVAAEDTDPNTGTLAVTFFEDRYADGLFDPASTSPNGTPERKRTELALNLIDVNGTRHYLSADAAGDFVFENIPVGPAQVYFPDPNSYRSVAFFDATGAASAADIERLPSGSYQGSPSGVLTVDVDADGEYRLIGLTALRLVADVRFADGTPASGVGISLGSNGEFTDATEYDFQPGSYEAFSTYHLPGQLGVKVTPPAGYGVATVIAGNNPGGAELPVTARDGGWWFSSTGVNEYFFNPTFTVVLEQLPDTTRPVVTLVTPAPGTVARTLDVRVDATDDRGLQRIVANIYQDGRLVKSTQTRIDGATSGSHTATVTLPDGSYTVKYNAQDLAGNISQTSSFAFTIDATAPKATIKDGAAYTVANGSGYDLVSFKLSDAGKIDKVTLNGKVKDLTNNAWSDVNFVKPGTFGGVKGENTLVVYDVAGNTSTYTFFLN